MDERMRDRRRSVSRQRGRRRGSVACVAVLVLVGVALFLWLRSSDVFAVTRITATATQYVTQEELAEVASTALGVSLLKLSTGEIERALRELPYVRSAQVYRGFPNTLEVRVEEYRPVARLKSSSENTLWLVAEDGRVLEEVKPPRGLNLPLIVSSAAVAPQLGKAVPGVVANALPIVTLLREGGMGSGLPAVQQIAVSAAGDLVLGLDSGTELRLGEPSQLEQKLMVAADIIERYLRDDRQVEYVDVTSPLRVAVKAK